MISLKQFNKLKENNALEAKQAINGIPNSIWETYSSFCNSYGGTILLGVKEDNTLKPIGLSEKQCDLLIKSFWDTINNSNKISINLLSDNDVLIHKIQNSYIIEIKVPQASKDVKPVYINNNPLLAYRRNYQGDYKCTKEEIFSMYRDQDNKSNDSYLVNLFTVDVLNKDSIQKYRIFSNIAMKRITPS